MPTMKAASSDEKSVLEQNVLELTPALMGQVRFPPGCSVLYQSPENDALTLMGTVGSACMAVDGHSLRQTHKRVSLWYRVQFIRSSQEQRMVPEAHLQYARKCPVWVRPQPQTQPQEPPSQRLGEWVEGTILASFQTEAETTTPSCSETEPNGLPAAAAAAAADTCYVVKLDGKEGRVGDITNNVTHDALRYRPPTTFASPSTPQQKTITTPTHDDIPIKTSPTTPARTNSSQTLTPPKESLPVPITLPVTVTSTHIINDNKTPTKVAPGSDMETSSADDSTMSGSSASGVTNHPTNGENATTPTSSPSTTPRTRIEYPPWLNVQHVHKVIALESRRSKCSHAFRVEASLHSILIVGLSEEEERTMAESLWNHLLHSMESSSQQQQVLRSQLILWVDGMKEPSFKYGHDHTYTSTNNIDSIRTMPPLMPPPSKRQKPDTPPPLSQPSPGSFTYSSLVDNNTKPNQMAPRGHYQDGHQGSQQFLTSLSSLRHARDDDHISNKSDNSDTKPNPHSDRSNSFHRQAIPQSERERYSSPTRSMHSSSFRGNELMLYLPPWLNEAIVTDNIIGHRGDIHQQLCKNYNCFVRFNKATVHGVSVLKVCNSSYDLRPVLKELINIILQHLDERKKTRFVYETARVDKSIPSAAWHQTVWEDGGVPILLRSPDEGMRLMWMGHVRLSKEGNPGGFLIGKHAYMRNKIQKQTNCRLQIIGHETDLPGPYALLIGRDRETVTNAIQVVHDKVNHFLLRPRNANQDGIL